MLKLKQKVEFENKTGYIIGMDIDPWDFEGMQKIPDEGIVYVIRCFDDEDNRFDYLRLESDVKVIE